MTTGLPINNFTHLGILMKIAFHSGEYRRGCWKTTWIFNWLQAFGLLRFDRIRRRFDQPIKDKARTLDLAMIATE